MQNSLNFLGLSSTLQSYPKGDTMFILKVGDMVETRRPKQVRAYGYVESVDNGYYKVNYFNTYYKYERDKAHFFIKLHDENNED